MNSHNNGSNADVIGNPRETQENQSGCMMNHLLFEVLHTCKCQVNAYTHRLPVFFADFHKKAGIGLVFKTNTHLSLHIKREAEEQRKVEAQFQDVIPVLRRQHGLREHSMHTCWSLCLPFYKPSDSRNTYLFREACPNLLQIIDPRFLQSKINRGGGGG